MSHTVPIGTGGGGRATPHTQKPHVMKENKTNTNSKGEIKFGVRTNGQRGTQKGCC
jgi:hypothetical protein